MRSSSPHVEKTTRCAITLSSSRFALATKPLLAGEIVRTTKPKPTVKNSRIDLIGKIDSYCYYYYVRIEMVSFVPGPYSVAFIKWVLILIFNISWKTIWTKCDANARNPAKSVQIVSVSSGVGNRWRTWGTNVDIIGIYVNMHWTCRRSCDCRFGVRNFNDA